MVGARFALCAVAVLGSCPINPSCVGTFQKSSPPSLQAEFTHPSCVISFPKSCPSRCIPPSLKQCHVHTALELQQGLGQRIMEQLGMEGTLMIIWLQPHRWGQRCRPPDTAKGSPGAVPPSLVPQPDPPLHIPPCLVFTSPCQNSPPL